MSEHNNNNDNDFRPHGIPPGWVFYPYPPVVVYPHHQVGQTSQILSLPAPTTQPAPSVPPPGPNRLIRPPTEASQELDENQQLILPAQIKFIACHHCGTCGRPRSHAYHKDHPLIPGQVAPASTCRKCIKKQDSGKPIDSIMLSMRSNISGKESTRSGQFYNPPSSEIPRGRVRSVSWRHVAPRGISRPRIESLDGFTNDPLELHPPPAPSAPRSAASEKPPSEKAPGDRLSRASSVRLSQPPVNKAGRAPSDRLSRTASSAGSSQRAAHSAYASRALPRGDPSREVRETIEVRTRRPYSPVPDACEKRSTIKASDRHYRTPTPDRHGESRHTHDHYRVRFERSPSQQRHALVVRDEKDLTPYFRHVEKRTKEVAPEPEAEKAPSDPKPLSDIAKPRMNAAGPTEKSRGRNMLLIRRSPSPSPVREPSPLRISHPRSGFGQSKARSDYEAYRAYHSRPPTPPNQTIAPSRPTPPPPIPSPEFGRGSFAGDLVGPWLNPQPEDNIAFSERSVNGSEATFDNGRKNARRSRYMDV